MNGITENCWAVDAGVADACGDDAVYIVAWVPIPKTGDDDDAFIWERNPQTIAALMAKPEETGIGFDWAASCEHHLEPFRNKLMSFMPDGFTADMVFVSVIIGVDYRTREVVIPEHRELISYMDVTEPASPPDRDPEAPYGRKADGSPRAKPGRKAASTKQ